MRIPGRNDESDLGLATIKRVEIPAARKEEVTNLSEVPAEELAALQTIGATVEYIEARSRKQNVGEHVVPEQSGRGESKEKKSPLTAA